jgi:hypothetical protein
VPFREREKANWLSSVTEEDRRRYTPQPTPKAAYEKYLDWLAAGIYDQKIELFTPRSKELMASLPITRAYHHFILMHEYGKSYEISVRNDLAFLYYTNDPLVAPHFLKKTNKGWKMDLHARFNNTQNRVGGVYVWDYCGSNDTYTKTFRDKLVNIKNYIRIKGGDNRQLPMRGRS